MLTELDDCLWHQLPTTFDHVWTSDPRFFDRFWFASYAPDGSAAMQFTMGVYRNMNVMDGGFVLVEGDRQYNIRVSRTLGQHNVMECGPLSVDVLEPLRTLALRVRGGDRVNGELTWTAVARPVEEAPHFRRLNGRTIEDYQRYNQIGSVSGHLVVDGREVRVDSWWACRDHSWGVRPGMAVKEVQNGPKDTLEKRGYTLSFLFFSAGPLSGTLLLQKREGDASYISGELMHAGDGTSMKVAELTIEPELIAGTRRFRTIVLTARLKDGRALKLHCHRSGNAIAMQGLGYSGGYNDRKGLGAWRGDQVVEQDVWNVEHPAKIVYDSEREPDEHWHRIQPVTIQCSLDDVQYEGQGSMTLTLGGKIPSLGLGL
ncbi:hypothetical protein SAMN02927924_00020 [Sphingobium faniae]|nr:hypothetical protein SAMN02927924_00020 [Sphingobium faniae]